MLMFSVVALALDTPTLSIILAFAGSVVTATVGAFVSLNLNKNEKKQAAETALEKALRERITLRDEELAELKKDLQEARDERDKAIAQRDRLYMAIAEHRAEERDHNDDS